MANTSFATKLADLLNKHHAMLRDVDVQYDTSQPGYGGTKICARIELRTPTTALSAEEIIVGLRDLTFQIPPYPTATKPPHVHNWQPRPSNKGEWCVKCGDKKP